MALLCENCEAAMDASRCALAYIRYRWMKSPLGSTIVQVIIGGGIVFALGIWLGRFGAAG